MIRKKIYQKLLLLAALPAFILASCSKEETPGGQDTQNKEIRFEMSFAPIDIATQTDPQTRVATDNEFKSTWEEGDEIGIFAVKNGRELANSGNLFHNVKLTYSSANGGKWTAAEPMYWPADDTKLDFYAYYPYNESISDLQLEFWLPEDQSGMTDEGQPVYNRNDLLWCKNTNGIGKNDGTVSLPFSHMLAMVQVKVSSSMLGDYPPDALDVWLDGAVIGSNRLHISEGSLAETLTPSKIKMYPCPTDDGKGTYAYRALVMPCSITDGTTLFRFEYNDDTEPLTSPPLTTVLELVPGRVETFDMTLPVTLVTVSPTVRIADLISADKLGAMTHLKVLGEMTEADFTTVRESMTSITSLDLGGATVVGNAIPDEAFKQKITLKEFVFPRNITTIGDGAFDGCSGLTGNLVIPDEVTTIGASAFSECSGFEGTLTLSKKLKTIGNGAFFGCSGLTGDLVIPNEVTTIGNEAFYGCSGFKGTLTLSQKLTTIAHSAFDGCRGLTGVLVIPDEVTTIGNYAFSHCSGLTGSLVIPNKVTTIGYAAFNSCSSFNGSLTIPQSVTTINDYAFYNCSSLTSITCHIQNPTNVANGSSTFTGVSNITLYVPNGTESDYSKTQAWSKFTDIQPIP